MIHAKLFALFVWLGGCHVAALLAMTWVTSVNDVGVNVHEKEER